MKTNTNQPGSHAAPESNASGTNGAATALAEQSDGTFPFRNNQNVDHPTGYGNASQWQWSNGEVDNPNSETRLDWNSEKTDEIVFNDKEGKLSDTVVKIVPRMASKSPLFAYCSDKEAYSGRIL